jgi:hypothetical protein
MLAAMPDLQSWTHCHPWTQPASLPACQVPTHVTCTVSTPPPCPVARRLLPEADLEPFLARVKDATLRHSLSYGVGYLHESMGAAEQAVVSTLFSSGAIQVRGSCCGAAQWDGMTRPGARLPGPL